MPVERLSEVAQWRDVFAALDHADQWWSRWHKEGTIHRGQLQELLERYAGRRREYESLEEAGKPPPSDLGLPAGQEGESVAARTLRYGVFLQKEVERPTVVRLFTLAQLHALRAEIQERQAALAMQLGAADIMEDVAAPGGEAEDAEEEVLTVFPAPKSRRRSDGERRPR